MLKDNYVVLYILVLVANILSTIFHWTVIEIISKTLLMPILVLSIIKRKKSTSEINWRLIMAGLFFAWAGDVLLLFTHQGSYFFVCGLVFFLCCHIAYIFYFNRYKPKTAQWIKQHPLLSLLVVVYGISLFSILKPNLGGLAIPVAFYTVIICLMTTKALSVQQTLPAPQSYLLFVAGAILFVISDSVLAIHRFLLAIPLAGAWIMGTYGIAQLLIVRATILNNDKKLESQGEID
jgi:uncharacterized membrane protein YhhN